MEYQIPSLESLLVFANGELRVRYHGKNRQRLSFINFYENLAAELVKDKAIETIPQQERETIRQLLAVALIFEYAWIWVKEYHGKSPEQTNHLVNKITQSVCNFFNEQQRDQLGSELYTVLKEKLADTIDNQITYRICLTCINHLYIYLMNQSYQNSLLLKNDSDTSIWKKKEMLLDDILSLLKEIKKVEWDRITPEFVGSPTPLALQKNLTEGSKKYREIVASRSYLGQWLTKRSHIEASHFVDFINDSCSELSANKDEDALTRIRSGAALYVLLTVYNEYALLSPQYGSDLFAQYLHDLHAKEIWKIDVEMQEDHLNSLLSYVNDIRHNRNYLNLTLAWEKKGLDLDRYFKQVIKTIPEQQVLLQSPWWYQTLFSHSVQYGTGAAIVRYGLPALAKAAIGSMSGPAGVIFYIAGSTIFMTQLGVMVTNNVIPRSALYVYGLALQKLGNQATSTASTVAFSANKTLQEWWGYKQLSQEDKDELEEFIQNTLLKLPNGVLSEREKEEIRVVFGFENEKEMMPFAADELELDEFVHVQAHHYSVL